jgi:hypothetical protein
MKIVSNPEQVCFEHALEFWTGLLAHVRDGPDRYAKHEGLWSRSRRDSERFPIRLAS